MNKQKYPGEYFVTLRPRSGTSQAILSHFVLFEICTLCFVCCSTEFSIFYLGVNEAKRVADKYRSLHLIVTTQINSTNNLVELYNWSLTHPPHPTTNFQDTFRQPRKLIFGIQPYFYPTRRNMKKKFGVLLYPLHNYNNS